MVYGFVKQSGGHVTIYSEQRHGPTVNLYLPRAEDPGGRIRHETAREEDPRAKGETVLVLEDDAELLQKPFRRYELARKLRAVLDST